LAAWSAQAAFAMARWTITFLDRPALSHYTHRLSKPLAAQAARDRVWLQCVRGRCHDDDQS
jgi:hypothetical protein